MIKTRLIVGFLTISLGTDAWSQSLRDSVSAQTSPRSASELTSSSRRMSCADSPVWALARHPQSVDPRVDIPKPVTAAQRLAQLQQLRREGRLRRAGDQAELADLEIAQRRSLEAPRTIKYRRPGGQPLPEEIRLTEGARFREEVSVGGQSFGPSSRMPELLPNESYVYVIDDAGNVAIMPEFLENASAEAFIGNHPALVRNLQTQNPHAQVLAAGEIKLRNGQIYEINNQSGSRRGNKAHLDFAAETLRARGLPIQERTLVRDLSADPKSSYFHATRKEDLVERKTKIDSARRARFEAALMRVQARYPDKNTPGGLDERVVDAVIDVLGEDEGLDVVSALLGSTPIDTTLLSYADDVKNFDRMLSALENFIDR